MPPPLSSTNKSHSTIKIRFSNLPLSYHNLISFPRSKGSFRIVSSPCVCGPESLAFLATGGHDIVIVWEPGILPYSLVKGRCRHTSGHGPRVTGHGSRDTGHGLRATGHGSRATGHGPRVTDHWSGVTGHGPRVTRSLNSISTYM